MLLMSLASLAFAQELETLHPELPQDDPAIINGEDAEADDWASAGGMILDAFLDLGSWGSGDLRMFMCSSTLIAPDVVLLAAHCLDDEALTYGLGTVEDKKIYWTRQADLSDLDGSSASAPLPDDAVQAWDWVMHEDFDLFGMETGIAENHDIALLFLDEPVLDVAHATLITEAEADQVTTGAEVVVVGWGQQEATDNPLQPPPAGTYAYKQMGVSAVADEGSHEFQVGEEEADVRKCHGDSGGPSYLEVTDEGRYTDHWRVVGVTSHAYDRTDCDSKGGVDTRVSAYLDWIDAELRSRCEDGTRSWCEVAGIVPPPEPASELGDTGGVDAGDGEEGGPLAGCGCASSPSPAGALPWLAAVLGVLGLRRRR